MISSTIPSAKYSCSRIATHVLKRKHRDRGHIRESERRSLAHRRTGLRHCSALTTKLNPPRSHWLGYVLEVLRAKVIEGNFDLAPDLPLRVIRNADTTGLGDPFEPGRDVHTVAENIVVVDDDVSDVDANTKFKSAILLSRPCYAPLMLRWISTAHLAASTALANSTSMPSPVVFTMRPR